MRVCEEGNAILKIAVVVSDSVNVTGVDSRAVCEPATDSRELVEAKLWFAIGTYATGLPDLPQKDAESMLWRPIEVVFTGASARNSPSKSIAS
ncbi:hypothetical protein [Stieleria varia]|uniref:Uncharacterized protein n=1 Tax=Stieleria varia TaxID=2528005 RepID=A0A5C6ANI7_9BACT|nr:hypothetical protein [Stieleria varia]TWU01078.1 hypothetical protein Pla52n_44490 [Stieleria varia]